MTAEKRPKTRSNGAIIDVAQLQKDTIVLIAQNHTCGVDVTGVPIRANELVNSLIISDADVRQGVA